MDFEPSLQISLRGCSVQAGGRSILRVPAWNLRCGERWLFEGRNGSGKSALLRLLAGREWPEPVGGQPRSRRFHFGSQATWSPIGARAHIALLDPDLQNRYMNQDSDLTVAEVVASGFEDTVFLDESLSDRQMESMQCALARWRIDELAGRLFVQLSRGERRRVLVARALVREPQVLLLDEFLEGLDRAGQMRFARWLKSATRGRTSVVLATHRPFVDDVQGWRRLVIEDGVARCRQDGSAPRRASSRRASSRRPAIEDGVATRERRREINHGRRTLLQGWGPCEFALASPRDSLVSIRNGEFYNEDRLLVRDLNWDIKAGGHWLLLGENGSGKTSILRLLWGEMHLASGGRMFRFGKTGLTVHQIRRRCGFFQPDFHGRFPRDQSGADVIISGFFGSIGLMDRPTVAQRHSAARIAAEVGIEDLLGRPLGEMAYGQVRRVLLARALVHRPELLLLDEPFDGLDRNARALVAAHLGKVVRHLGATVVLSAHQAEDVPEWIELAALIDSRRLAFYKRARST